MNLPFARIATRIFGAPLLVLPERAFAIADVFNKYVTGEHKLHAMEDHQETEQQRAEREQARRQVAYAGIQLQNKPEKPYALTASGIALLPVIGTLVQRGSWMDAESGLQSYDNVASLLERSMSDPDVRAILFEVDSPGGEVGGLFDLAGRIRAASKKKPIWSSAVESAYSAGYAILASGEHAYAALTGGVGSIGALMLHVDQSKRDSMMGYAYTYIASGTKKAEGNPHEPLSKGMLAWAQNEVNRTGELFARTVASYRSIQVEDVLATEAGLLTPLEAVDGGYIDGVAGLLEVAAMLDAELRQPGSTAATRSAARTSLQEKKAMTTKQEQDAAAQARAAELDVVRKEGKAEGAAEGETKGRAAGVTAERERIAGILACEEASGRTKFALHLALKTDSDLAAAKGLLAAAQKETGGADFAAAMAKLGNPEVGVDGGDKSRTQQPAINAQKIFADRAKARTTAN